MRRKHCRKIQLCGRFEESGYRFTRIRSQILDVLKNKKGHLSIEDIFLELAKNNITVNLTTIYRNLEILEVLGFVKKFDFGDGRARFELIYDNNLEQKYNHHHLVCIKCGDIINFECSSKDEHKSEIKIVENKYNFEIKEHIVQFRGLCKNCLQT